MVITVDANKKLVYIKGDIKNQLIELMGHGSCIRECAKELNSMNTLEEIAEFLSTKDITLEY